MNRCVVSQKAHQDIRELFEFGSQKLGKDQALRYVEELNSYFSSFCKIREDRIRSARLFGEIMTELNEETQNEE